MFQGNHLLSSLPAEVSARLTPHFERIRLTAHQNVFSSGDRLDYVYFPLDSVVYLFMMMENGLTVETGMIGCEGVVGLSAFFGVNKYFNHATVASANNSLRIKADIIKREFDAGGSFYQSILRYAHSFFVQISQTAACNRTHQMEAKLCRWLLVMRDIAKSETLAVTQEFIARMLGTQRPYVTTAIGLLQKQRIIRCGRGIIEILDYRELEKCSCECYPIIQEQTHYLNSIPA